MTDINRLAGRLKAQDALKREYYQYHVLPPWWIPVQLKQTEILQAVASANNLNFSHLDEIEADLDAYVTDDTKNKIIGRIGKYAVAAYYGFSMSKVLSKNRRGYYDFEYKGKRVVVKSTGFLRAESILLGESDAAADDGPDIYIAANLDIDLKDLYATTVYITGWVTREGFCQKCFIAEDMKPGLVFLPAPAMSQPKSLLPCLKLVGA